MTVEIQRYDLDQIRKAINVLFADVKFGAGECIEVRVPDKRKKLTAGGWFDDTEALAKAARLLPLARHTEGKCRNHHSKQKLTSVSRGCGERPCKRLRSSGDARRR